MLNINGLTCSVVYPYIFTLYLNTTHRHLFQCCLLLCRVFVPEYQPPPYVAVLFVDIQLVFVPECHPPPLVAVVCCYLLYSWCLCHKEPTAFVAVLFVDIQLVFVHMPTSTIVLQCCYLRYSWCLFHKPPSICCCSVVICRYNL